jgi:apolipoprotein N-acyltransferase
MVVALLVLIVLVLLFGAAAVKGWIKSALVWVLGFAVICTAIIWLGSFLGEDGFLYVVLGIGAFMLAFAALGWVLSEIEKRRANAVATEIERKRARKEQRRQRRQLFEDMRNP